LTLTEQKRQDLQFWILTGFLVLIFVTGGSSRSEAPGLIFLRPISAILAVYAIMTITKDDWYNNRYIIVITVLALALVGCHLLPLPPSIWHNIPGRSLVYRILDSIQQNNTWLPFTMSPSAGLNAFYSLFTPLAIYFLAIQLHTQMTVRLIRVVIALGTVSAFVGVLQAVGVGPKIYSINSEVSGLLANRNHQAALLSIMFPLMIVNFISITSGKLYLKFVLIFTVAMVLLFIPLIIITGSRMGLMLSFMAGIGIFFLKTPQLVESLKPKKGRIILIIGAISCLILSMAIVAKLTSRDAALSRFASVDSDPRYSTWSVLFEIIPQYLPLGSGVGSYVEVYQIHEPSMLLHPEYSNHAHSDFLEVLLTMGFPGVALVIMALAMWVIRSWAARHACGLEGVINRLGLLIIFVLAIASTVDYPLRTPIMAAVFAIAARWATLARSKVAPSLESKEFND
jgi:O-antigen ligase